MNATFLPPQRAPYTFPALPPEERRPIRVLSLFDGIASGKYENGLVTSKGGRDRNLVRGHLSHC